ncbi:MAG: GNAT family N-acetyltransferase [Candidatus Electryonea clarkiae]|nr:GNAT family N-acetyltransferase [Candidatus Electryonea clarkiae]MDP8285457.1 GNAT family N-acetyltransferase [Candidatus Electryonea clarkiae]
MISKNPGCTLRFAEEEDIGLILRFIRELAEYEKLPHEVVADENILHESLFGERSTAEVIIAELEGCPVGFALFFHNFSTFLGKPGIYLEDIFIKPEHRGNGISKLIFAFLAKLAKERDCGRIEWSVLNWNKPMIGFSKNIGAEPMDEWTTFRISGKELSDLVNYENSGLSA